MNTRTTFWRCLLAALGLAACLLLFLAGMNTEAVGQDGHGHDPIEVKQTDSPFVEHDHDNDEGHQHEHGGHDHGDGDGDAGHRHDDGDRDHDHDGDEGHQHDDEAEHRDRDREHQAWAEAQHEKEIHALSREREELRERAGQIEREMHGLRDGQDEEARELHGAMEEVRNRLGQLHRELGDGERRERDQPRQRDVHPLAAERQGLLERAEAFEHRLRELGDRDDEEAQAIRREVERAYDEIRERVAHINRELDHGERGRERERAEREGEMPELLPELTRLQERLFELDVARQSLGEGEREKSEQLSRQLDEVLHRSNQIREQVGDLPEEFVLQSRRRAIELTHQAARRFAEAGKPDLAERCERNAREMAEQLEVAARQRGERHEREHPEARRGPDDLGPAIHEIRQQMNEMRREMAEMREMMQQLLERE